MALSANIYTGDGATTNFAVNFTLGFISRSDVVAYVEDELDGSLNQIYRTIVWVNDGLITLSPAPADTKQVFIRRVMDKDALQHDFQDGAVLNEVSLDEANLQLLYICHEILDGFYFPGLEVRELMDMNGFRIKNLGDPVDANDALSNTYYETYYAPAMQAAIAASEAAAADSAAAAIAAADAAEAAAGGFTHKREVQVATEGQTVFVLTTFTYQVATNQLTVHIDGRRQYTGSAYAETNTTTVTFAEGLSAGQEVLFGRSEAVGASTLLGTVSPDNSTAVMWKGLNLLKADLTALAPQQFGYSARCVGRDVANDGYEGFFVYTQGDFTTEVALDTLGGVFVPSASDPTGATGCWVRQFRGQTSILWYGAVGDGVTDCTAAIQAACYSLPLNIANVGILTPKGFANGGNILIPRGRYKVTSKISLQRGTRFSGESRESSQIVSFIGNDSVFQYLDQGRYIQDEFVFENMSIWQDASVVATAGAAIDIITGPAASQSLAIQIDNVLIEGTYRGVRLEAIVGGSISNCNISKCVQNGVEVAYNASVSSTSLSFYNTYVHICGGDGFNLFNGAYMSFVGVASDSNQGYGYYVRGGHGHKFQVGAEQNVSGAMYFKDAASMVVTLDCVQIGTDKHCITTDNIQGALTIIGGTFSSIDNVTGYAIYQAVLGGRITAIGIQVVTTYIGRETNSTYKYLHLDDANGLVGASNHWAIGATQAPETDTVFAVTGLGGTENTNGFKVLPTFENAGTVRNAGLWSQPVTNNNGETYPLMVGGFFPDVAKGATDTINRQAGLYLQEQTKGTYNANLMIDAGSGTVPAGQWSIYSDSVRPSLFKGAIQFVNLAAISAPNNSMFVNTADGKLSFKNSAGVTTALY